MKTRSLSLKISPSIGVVSAECLIPENSQCIMNLAQGAGAGINQSFMVRKQIKDLEFTGGT